MKGSGVVIKIYTDDLKGSKHQRFTLRLKNKKTVLVIHNIDIAPKIYGLNIGDTVEFMGQYQWNKLGGMIHWTHHDPNAKHPLGWLKHNGKLYS
ncbi:MAG: DUF3465 domain-containing protein [Colwelliaceae bacterium]|jgi:hypothetical protein|nr:DUF3465 domain-containing protein [Colwelliaceae bacterium]